MHTDPELIMRALEAGAHGYLLKDTTATELEQALQALAQQRALPEPGDRPHRDQPGAGAQPGADPRRSPTATTSRLASWKSCA